MEWYAVFVRTGKEEEVQKWLNLYYGLEKLQCLIPRKKILEKKAGKADYVLKKIFPGYLFIHTEMSFDKYKKIKHTPNLLRVLNTGMYYSQVDKAEILELLKLVDEDGIINCSIIDIENSKIIIKEGPLYGMEGIVKKIDKHKRRAKLEINLMGEAKIVDVGIEFLNKY